MYFVPTSNKHSSEEEFSSMPFQKVPDTSKHCLDWLMSSQILLYFMARQFCEKFEFSQKICLLTKISARWQSTEMFSQMAGPPLSYFSRHECGKLFNKSEEGIQGGPLISKFCIQLVLWIFIAPLISEPFTPKLTPILRFCAVRQLYTAYVIVGRFSPDLPRSSGDNTFGSVCPSISQCSHLKTLCGTESCRWGRRTDRRTDMTKRIISLASRSIKIA